jgi:hypothetical protein
MRSSVPDRFEQRVLILSHSLLVSLPISYCVDSIWRVIRSRLVSFSGHRTLIQSDLTDFYFLTSPPHYETRMSPMRLNTTPPPPKQGPGSGKALDDDKPGVPHTDVSLTRRPLQRL